MNDTDTIADELVEAMQGDSDAIAAVARRLRRNSTEQPSGHSLAADHLGHVVAIAEQRTAEANAFRQRAEALEAVRKFEHEFRDVREDPAAWAEAKRIDMALAQEHPEMTPAARFTAAGRAVRKQFGTDMTEADIAREGMKQIAGTRRCVQLNDEARGEDDDSEIERGRSDVISEMKRARIAGRTGEASE